MFGKKILLALIAVIGLGLMTLSLNASEMKCGAGKCGSAMSKDMKGKGCTCEHCDHDSCAAKKDPSKACDCKHEAIKCGKGKCGGKKSDKAMKCGAGKCGSK